MAVLRLNFQPYTRVPGFSLPAWAAFSRSLACMAVLGSKNTISRMLLSLIALSTYGSVLPWPGPISKTLPARQSVILKEQDRGENQVSMIACSSARHENSHVNNMVSCILHSASKCFASHPTKPPSSSETCSFHCMSHGSRDNKHTDRQRDALHVCQPAASSRGALLDGVTLNIASLVRFRPVHVHSSQSCTNCKGFWGRNIEVRTLHV